MSNQKNKDVFDNNSEVMVEADNLHKTYDAGTFQVLSLIHI